MAVEEASTWNVSQWGGTWLRAQRAGCLDIVLAVSLDCPPWGLTVDLPPDC